MEETLLASIKNGNAKAMVNLGCYYYEKKDYENVVKYYLTAIEKMFQKQCII